MATYKQQHSAEYQALRNAIHRCHAPINHYYHAYGGRGITVCDEWRAKDGFKKFLEHIGPKPSPELTLDRIDNEKGYEPGNVRWATMSEQNRNRRERKNARKLTFQGETLSVREWAARIGVSSGVIHSRLYRKLPLERVLAPIKGTPTNP